MLNNKIKASQEQRTVLLRKILLHAYDNTVFYSTYWDKNNILREDLINITFNDLHLLPSIDEQTLRNNWRDMSYFDKDAFRASTSGGTTGLPKLLVRTQSDWRNSLDSHIKLLKICGINKSSRMLIILPFDIWCVGFLTLESCREIGCFAVPVGIHMKDDVILKFAEAYNVNTVFCTPSRLMNISSMLTDSHIFLKGLKMLLAGETISNYCRINLQNTFEGVVKGIYGSEETDGLAAECNENSHNMHLLNDKFIFEIRDLNSGKLKIEEGNGELFITSLYHLGTPLIRYKIGDLVEIKKSNCNCKNNFPIIQVRGKVGEVLFFRDAMKVYGYQIEEAINSVFGSLLPFQAIAKMNDDNKEILEICLQANNLDNNQITRLRNEIKRVSFDIDDSINMGFLEIEVTTNSRYQMTSKGKFKRFIDNRK